MKRAFSILLLSLVFSHLAWARAEFTNEHYDFLPGAKVFRGQTQNHHYVGFKVGDGRRPVLLLGGIILHVPYLRMLIDELAKNDFTVYAVNLVAHGNNDFVSGKNSEEKTLGIAGSLEILGDAIDFSYQDSGKKKLIAMGHSSGGTLLRMASLGVNEIYEKDHPLDQSISEEKKQAYREKVLLTVPFFSPLIHPFHEITKKQKRLFKTTGLFLAPANLIFKRLDRFTDEGSLFWKKIWWGAFSSSMNLYLRHNQKMIGNKNVDKNEFKKAVSIILPERFPRVLLQDIRRWGKNFEMIAINGFSYSQAWIDQQNSSDAVETLLIFGQKDGLVHQGLSQGEINATGDPSIYLDVGHTGALFDQHLIHEMIEKLKDYSRLANQVSRSFS